MKNLKQIEKLMMLASRKNSPDCASAYRNVITVYRHIDEINHSNHCKILNSLYNVSARKFTYLGLSKIMNISDNALRRYRADYTGWFAYYFNLVRAGKMDF